MGERANSGKWARVRQRLRTELGEDVFNSWFGRVEFEQEDKSTVYLSVPTRFLKSWIMSHYYDRLLALWKAERGDVVRIEVIVRGAIRAKAVPSGEGKAAAEAAPAARPAAPATSSTPAALRRSDAPEGHFSGSPVDNRYSFDTFCDGAANRLAFAAAGGSSTSPTAPSVAASRAKKPQVSKEGASGMQRASDMAPCVGRRP